MATPQAEREARERGDIVVSRIAPLAGALLGAGAALELVAGAAPERLSAWTRRALAFEAAPAEALHGAGSLVASLVAPLAIGSFVGAIAVGLLQTRVYLGRFGPPPPERETPAIPLAALGWLAIALVALARLRPAPGLAVGSDSLVVGRAAAVLARGIGQAFLVGVAAIALADHLLRARARQARLETAPGRRARSAAVPGPDLAALLSGAERVIVDGDRALIVARRAGAWVALTRADGLSGRALVEMARGRGLPVRAAIRPEALGVALGVALGPDQRSALGLPA